MRKDRAQILNAATLGFLLSLTTATVFAADSILIGGLARHGIAGQVIRVPIVIKDNAGTPAGADQNTTIVIQSKDLSLSTTLYEDHIRSIAFLAGFDTDSKVNDCANGTGPLLANCDFTEAGIAPTLNVVNGSADPCGSSDWKPDSPCYYRQITATVPASAQGNTVSLVASYTGRNAGGTIDVGLVTNQAAPRGDLVGYLKLKLSPSFPAGGTVTVSLDKIVGATHFDAEAYLSGYDVYTTIGNPSTDERIANAALTLANYQPADVDNNGSVQQADLTAAINAFMAAPGSSVDGTNFRADCDGDGKLTGADVMCVYNELSPSVGTGTQHALLDVDQDGNIDALTDGLLIFRRAFGFSGATLISGAVASGAQRTDATQIANYIDSIAPALDVDGTAGFDALTDGLLLFRYMFGFTGNTLISSAVANGAPRATAPQIQGFIALLETYTP